MVEKGKLTYISTLRVFATLLVVLFHSYAVYFYDIGFDFSAPFIPCYKNIFIIEELIQMPLFAFIAGYLFSFQQEKYPNVLSVVYKKFRRLIVPYLVFGLIIYFTVPVCIQNIINPLYAILHLWFLLMLFWCFLFHKLMLRYNRKIIFLIAIVMTFAFRHCPEYLCFPAFCRYYIYFYLGYYYKSPTCPRTSIYVNVFKYLSFSIVSFFSVYFYGQWNVSIVMLMLYHIITLLGSVLGITILFDLFQHSRCVNLRSPIVAYLDKNSLAIYILHYWIMMMVFAFKPVQQLTIHFMIFFLVFSSLVTARIIKFLPGFKSII